MELSIVSIYSEINAILELVVFPVQNDWIAVGLENEIAVTTIPITRMTTHTKKSKIP